MFNDQPATASAEVDAEATASDHTTVPVDDASAEQLEQLLVLSQAPLSLEEALEEEAAKLEDDPAVAPSLTVGGLIAQYAQLVLQLLGVGMVMASVRHYAAEPKLYLGIAIAGALLFAVASTVFGRRPAHGGALGAVRYGALSVLLAVGLGLLIGGVLHFTAFPRTGAVLVPLGLGLSVGAFVLRDGGSLVGRGFISTAVTIIGVLVWLGVGLGLAAKKLDPAPTKPAAAHGAPAAGDHGAAAAGDHGAAAEGDHGAAAAGDHGAAAEGDHGAAAAGDAHGEAAAKDAHGETPAGHGEATSADHGAAADAHGADAADHGTASKSAAHTPATAAHGDAADHGTAAKSDHGAEAKSDHAPAASSDHAAESSHGKASSSSHGAEKEDEVTADDVLVSRKH